MTSACSASLISLGLTGGLRVLPSLPVQLRYLAQLILRARALIRRAMFFAYAPISVTAWAMLRSPINRW